MLIAAVIATHPGAIQSGNTVQDGTVNRTWTIRTGAPATIYSSFLNTITMTAGCTVYSFTNYGGVATPLPFPSGVWIVYSIISQVDAITLGVQYWDANHDSLFPISYPQAGCPWLSGTFTRLGSAIRSSYTTSPNVAWTQKYQRNGSGNWDDTAHMYISAGSVTSGTPYFIDYQDTGSQLTISLSGGTNTEPWHKKHDPEHTKANLPYKAIVKDQDGQPKANINVTITTDVTSDSGGHVHTNGRPRDSPP